MVELLCYRPHVLPSLTPPHNDCDCERSCAFQGKFVVSLKISTFSVSVPHSPFSPLTQPEGPQLSNLKSSYAEAMQVRNGKIKLTLGKFHEIVSDWIQARRLARALRKKTLRETPGEWENKENLIFLPLLEEIVKRISQPCFIQRQNHTHLPIRT